MQLAVEIYISISYWQGTGDNLQAKNSIKKAQAKAQARQGTGDLVLVKFSEKQGTRILLEITSDYFSLELF